MRPTFLLLFMSGIVTHSQSFLLFFFTSFFLSLNSYFYHEEVIGRPIGLIVVVAFSYSLCGGSSVIFS